MSQSLELLLGDEAKPEPAKILEMHWFHTFHPKMHTFHLEIHESPLPGMAILWLCSLVNFVVYNLKVCLAMYSSFKLIAVSAKSK